MELAKRQKNLRARGALHSWAPISAARPRCSKPCCFAPGQSTRQGKVADKSTVGDASPEARAHGMSVELNVADHQLSGRQLHLHRLPGLHRIRAGLRAPRCRAAMPPSWSAMPMTRRPRPCSSSSSSSTRSACRASSSSTRSTSPNRAPRDVLAWMQPASSKPLILRQLPIMEEWHRDRVCRSRAGACLRLSGTCRKPGGRHAGRHGRHREAANASPCWKSLPTMTTQLMEQLLSDMEPPRDQVFADLSRELAEGHDHARALRLGRTWQRHWSAAEGAAP